MESFTTSLHPYPQSVESIDASTAESMQIKAVYKSSFLSIVEKTEEKQPFLYLLCSHRAPSQDMYC